MKGLNLDASGAQSKLAGLKGGGKSAAPAGPLLPSQGVYSQKAWLPWWLIPVVLLLAALAVALYLLLPKNVVVPDVVGSPSSFEAEKELIEADLVLNATPKQKVAPDAKPGSVVGQTPKAGEKAEKGAPVTIEIAVGDGKISVPKVTGLTLADAEAALRDKKLTLGQSSPQPPDPEGKIESQIPAENEIVKEGAPVDVFFADPNGKGKGKKENAKAGNAGAAAGGPGGGDDKGGDAEIIIPAIAKTPLEDYAQNLGGQGARARGQARLQRGQAQHPVRHRAARRHDGQGGHQGHAARVGRLPAARVRQRQERAAGQRRQRPEVRPDRGRPGAREGSDVEARRDADGLLR